MDEDYLKEERFRLRGMKQQMAGIQSAPLVDKRRFNALNLEIKTLEKKIIAIEKGGISTDMAQMMDNDEGLIPLEIRQSYESWKHDGGSHQAFVRACGSTAQAETYLLLLEEEQHSEEE